MANGMSFYKEEPNQTIDGLDFPQYDEEWNVSDFAIINNLTATEASYALVDGLDKGKVKTSDMYYWRGMMFNIPRGAINEAS